MEDLKPDINNYKVYEDHLTEGIRCHSRGDSNMALTFFEKALKISTACKKEILKYNDLRNICSANNELAKAENYMKKISEVYRDIIPYSKEIISKAYHYMGNVYWEETKHEKAIKCYEKAGTKLNAETAYEYQKQGDIFLARKEYADALNYYNKALDIQPNCENAYEKIGNVYWCQKKYKRAVEYYKKGNTKPKRLLAFESFEIGNAYFKQKEYNKAVEYYESAIKFSSDYVLAYNNLGATHRIMNNDDKATECYSKALKIEPNNQTATAGLRTLKRVQ